MKVDGHNYHVKLMIKDDDGLDKFITCGFLINSQYAANSPIGVGYGQNGTNNAASKVEGSWSFSGIYSIFNTPENAGFLIYDDTWTPVDDPLGDIGGTTSYQLTWPE